MNQLSKDVKLEELLLRLLIQLILLVVQEVTKLVNPSKSVTTKHSVLSKIGTQPIASELVPPNTLESTIHENLEIIEESELQGQEVIGEEKPKRTRRSLSKETFYDEFEGFMETFSKFYEDLKEDKNTKLPKTNYLKKLKQIQNDAYKLIKIKNLKSDKSTKNESNSGFMKPIQITPELAGFLDNDGTTPPIKKN